MGDEVYTNVEMQIDAATSAKSFATRLHDELTRIGREVDDLLCTWKGDSADAYGQSWSELHDAVQVIVSDLDDIGTHVGAAAYAYGGSDKDNADQLRAVQAPGSSGILRL